MIKKQLAVIAFAAVSVLPVTSVNAVESSANVALTSNYIFRGQTMSNDNMAVQGGYDIAQSKDSGWYAGVFASMFDFGPGQEDGIETDIFAGWKGSFGAQSAFGWDAGLIMYEYHGANNVEGQFEIFGGITYETAYLKLFIGDDDNQPTNNDYLYLDGGASFVVLEDIDLDLHVGHMSRDFAKDYFDASATLKKKVNGFDTAVSLTYESLDDEMEFLVTIGKSFDL
jgi:uncharacterized protein (TIGR02001 family)